MAKNKKELSTYDLAMQDPKRKKNFDKEYRKFVISELLLEVMEKENVTVRKLSKKSGVAPSIIQALRTEKRNNITLNNLSNIFESLGYNIMVGNSDNTYLLGGQ